MTAHQGDDRAQRDDIQNQLHGNVVLQMAGHRRREKGVKHPTRCGVRDCTRSTARGIPLFREIADPS